MNCMTRGQKPESSIGRKRKTKSQIDSLIICSIRNDTWKSGGPFSLTALYMYHAIVHLSDYVQDKLQRKYGLTGLA